MRLDFRQMPGTPSLLRDYIHAFDRLASFYVEDPRARGAWARRAEAVDRRRYPREALAAALRSRHTRWEAPGAALDRIAVLTDPRALVLITGQQTGLFGGPLYTLYKALTVVRMAEQLAADLARPVVAAFWLADEDHDVAEADHVTLPDRAGNPVTIRHARWGSPGYMPANLQLGESISAELQQVKELLPTSDFAPTALDALAQAYRPERTLADAFAQWLLYLLGDTGLVLVDAADPQLKALATPIFERELAEAPTSSRRILQATQALGAQGYPAQIEARSDGVNCFLLQDGRHPLVRDEGGFRLRDTGTHVPREDALRMARNEPERFSPNVALRPVVQDFLFPTLAYAAGPGELAYFAQLRGVYDAFDVSMPLIVPRASLTLVESRTGQLLDRFDLRLGDLTRDPEQLASRVLRAQLPPDFDAALAKARAAVDDIFGEVGQVVAAVDSTLRATVGQTAGHVKGHLDQLQRKAVQALKRREEETRKQVQRVREALMPGGRPQERIFPLLPYLAKYGRPVLSTIRQAIAGPGWDHLLLPLPSTAGKSSDDPGSGDRREQR